MKNKLFIALLLSVFFFAPSMAQNASINIKMAGVTKASCEVWVSDPPLKKSDFRKGYKDVPLKEQNSATEVFELKQPKFISMIFEPQKPEGKPIFYRFFLTPGDHLSVNIDFSKTANAIEVFGKGSNNNQPEIGTMKEPDIHSFYGDTLPNRVIATIIRQEVLNKKTVHDYILKYKPSEEFIKAWNLNLNYEAPETYYAFKENNKHGKNRSAFLRNANKWQKIQDSLFYSISSKKQSPIVLNKEINSRISMLNNQNALMSIYYTRLIESFLLREKESLWLESNNNPKSFYKDWYNTDDVAEGKKQFDDDQQTLLKEKIINKFFSGAPAEYLYIVLLEDAINESNPKNVAIIFDRFKQRYPKSRYIEWFSPDVSEIVKKQQQTLNSKMIFVENNGKKLNTLDEVLALAKGKTVLVDMWGTWCGPCRQEITENSAAIKTYFKDKGLDYLYIANFDSNNEDKWKNLIAYFQLDGTHVLANDDLNRSIMEKIKGQGYPTYFIIKKDGSYVLSDAGYPMKRDVLIKQIEGALAEK